LSRLGSLFDKDASPWIEVDFTRWGNKENDQHAFATIKDTILGQRVLTFVYCSSYGVRSERTVSPTKLVYKAHSWYLQGFCHDRQAFRTFKIGRMLGIQMTDKRFDRASLPEAAPIKENWQTEPVPPFVDAALRFQAQDAWRALDEFDSAQAEWDEDGTLTIRTHILWDTWLFGFILSFGAGVEVLAPASLRRAVIHEAQKNIEQYRKLDIQGSDFMGYPLRITHKKGGTAMEKKICQSCAMPMEKEQYGTNRDGSQNEAYCMYCYKDGAFTSDQTMEQMVDTCVPFMVEDGMTEEAARKIMNETLPQLKRWKKA
ncbi:MAG: WYL domain-containing protein, partial [Firmicutes bacterium]|nr:WYL domain-containing protein [Bacillota bacterium]